MSTVIIPKTNKSMSFNSEEIIRWLSISVQRIDDSIEGHLHRARGNCTHCGKIQNIFSFCRCKCTIHMSFYEHQIVLSTDFYMIITSFNGFL